MIKLKTEKKGRNIDIYVSLSGAPMEISAGNRESRDPQISLGKLSATVNYCINRKKFEDDFRGSFLKIMDEGRQSKNKSIPPLVANIFEGFEHMMGRYDSVCYHVADHNKELAKRYLTFIGRRGGGFNSLELA